MNRPFLAFAAAIVAAAACLSGPVLAGDPAPSTPAAPTPAAPATPAKTAEAVKPATKTPTPFHSMLGWLGKQVAPSLDCACPSTAEGEKAWRAWFTGGKDVPAAALRDALVADGWTADQFVGFFQAMAKAHAGEANGGACHGDAAAGTCDGGKCDGSKCEGGKCEGGRCGGKCEGGACPEKKDGACGGCKDKPAAETPTAKPADKPAETSPKP